MQSKTNIFFTLLAALFVLCALPACENKNNDSTPSSETKLTGIVFAKNDSFPDLKNATFTIDLSPDTALVYNEDSLAVGTRIDSVVATFYFTTTIGYALFVSDSDTTLITAADTLNFVPRPCHLHVVSQDMQNTRDYNIFVNVHTVDPDLYVWTQTQDKLFQGNRDVHAETLGDEVLLFTQDGLAAQLYTSADNGRTWNGPATPAGLPKTANIRQIIASPSRLYYAQDNHLYASTDGRTWSDTPLAPLSSMNPGTLLFYYNDSIWAIAEEIASGNLWFLTMPEGGTFSKQTQIGPLDASRFPVSDFSAIAFTGVTGRRRAMILGGYDKEGTMLNSRWNLEWVDTDSYDGLGLYRIEDFSIEHPDFPPIAGAAVTYYDNRLLLFTNPDNASPELGKVVAGQKGLYESLDEGMNWTTPDSAANVLPDEISPRNYSAVVVTPDQAVLLIGGRDNTTSYADVWRARKNAINW